VGGSFSSEEQASNRNGHNDYKKMPTTKRSNKSLLLEKEKKERKNRYTRILGTYNDKREHYIVRKRLIPEGRRQTHKGTIPCEQTGICYVTDPSDSSSSKRLGMK